MISDCVPYPKYRDSGVEWLGAIPAHWNLARNKQILAEINEKSEDGNGSLLTVSQYTGVSIRSGNALTRSESLVGYKKVQPGDLVFNIMLAWNGSLGVSEAQGLASPAYCVYRPIGHTNSRFLHYLFRTPLFTSLFKIVSTGIVESRLRLYPEVFFRLHSILPPADEQAAIVRFLDHADRRIRRYIRAKRKLIALLNEQKQVIIQQAVTRGLDPSVPMKDSGIEWLGEIPAHWEVVKLRHLATKFGSGITPRGGSAVYQETGIPLLRSQNVHFDGLKLDKVARIPVALHQQLAGTHVRAGDVLLNITGASLGRVTAVPPDFEQGNVNQHVCIIRPRPQRLLSAYLAAYLSTPFMQREIYTEQNGAAREGLALDAIRSFYILLPPLDEQILIMSAISGAVKQLESACQQAEREITLVQSYRTRLIADVVTGKLDVREAARRLPDELDDFDEPDDLSLDELSGEEDDLAELAEVPDAD